MAKLEVTEAQLWAAAELYPDIRMQLAKHSPAFFSKYYLGKQFYEHQKPWATHLKRTRRGGVLAPTGHGKTFVAAEVLMLQRICYNRNQRNLIYAAGVDHAVENASVLSTHLKHNDRIIRDFGRFYDPHSDDTWGKTKFIVIRDEIHKNATVHCAGILTEITGSKFHHILFEDVATDKNMREEAQRRKIHDIIHGTVKHRLEAGGTMWFTGTRKHYLDLYAEFIDSITWDVMVDKAIIEEPEGYEIIELEEKDWIVRDDLTLQKVVVKITGDRGKVLCEGLFPMEDLLIERYDDRRLFMRERQNEIVSGGLDIFHLEDLEASRDFDMSYVSKFDDVANRGYAFLVAGTDPAIAIDTKKAEAHDTSYMVSYVWGVYSNGNADLLYYSRERGLKTRDKIANTKKLSDKFRLQAHYWESNSFGVIQIETLREDTNVPIVSAWTGSNKHDDLTGIPALGLMYENGKLKMPYKTPEDREKTNLIISELLAVGTSTDVKSDDVMALWITKCGADNELRKRDSLIGSRKRQSPKRSELT